MIECADLKNVINYQEVEALKHTIKVLRGSDEWRKIVEECVRQQHVKAIPQLKKSVLSGFIHHQVEGS